MPEVLGFDSSSPEWDTADPARDTADLAWDTADLAWDTADLARGIVDLEWDRQLEHRFGRDQPFAFAVHSS